MDVSSAIAAGGSVGLFSAVAAILFRMLILQNRREGQTDDDIHALKVENAWCNKRVSILIFACQQGGISIPQEVWDGPPQVITALGDVDTARRSRHSRRRRRRDPFDPPNND